MGVVAGPIRRKGGRVGLGSLFWLQGGYMAKVRNTPSMSFATLEARIRAFLNIPSGNDDDLEELFDTAVRAADRYMNNFFLDADGNDIDPLPKGVLRGVLVYMASAMDVDDEGITEGTASVKTGDLAQAWGGGFTPNKAALGAAKPHWINFRCRFDR